jgi:uncharacterized protein
MRLLVIADDDSLVGQLEPGPVDVLISLGDLFDGAITKAMERYQPRRTFAVRGNHDPDVPFPGGVTDLHLSVQTFEGVRFGGFKGSWKYKPRGHHLFEQKEVSQMMRYFPSVDVFIAHNSPAGIHQRDSDVHQGFDGFNDFLQRTQPTLMLHGHQHLDLTTVQGQTTILGVYGERMVEIGPVVSLPTI